MAYKRNRRTSLTERLQYMGIREGIVITRTKGIELGVQFSLPSQAEVTEQDRDILSDAVRRIIIQTIPQGCRGRLIVECTPISYTEMNRVNPDHLVDNELLRELVKIGTDTDELRRQRGQLSTWRYFFTIRLNNRQRRMGRAVPFVRAELDPLLMRAVQIRTQLLDMLNAGGFPARPMSGQDAFELIWRYFNPGYAAARAPLFKSLLDLPNKTQEQVKKDFSIQTNSLREQLTETEIDTSRIDSLVVGNRMVQTINMLGKPNSSRAGMPENLLKRLAGKQFYYVLDMEHLDQSEKAKQLNSAARGAATATVDTSLGSPDVSNTSRLDSLSRVIYRLDSEGEHVFKMGISMVLIARSKEELEIMTETARTEMSMMGGMRAAGGTVQNIPQYTDRLAPMNAQINEFLVEAFSVNVADFWPLTGPYTGSRDPVAVYSNRYGTLTGINPAENTNNYGMLFVGGSGSGKTFLTQSWITKTAALGAEIIIVDQKRDYASLIAAMDGQFIPFAPGEMVGNLPMRYNAFELDADETEPDENQKMFLLSYVAALLNENSLDSVESSIVAAAIEQVYEASRQTTPNGTVIRTRVVTLSIFVRTMANLNTVGEVSMRNYPEGLAAVKRMQVGLQRFMGNTPLGTFFDGESTIQINNKYIYFDISRIKEQEVLNKVAMLLIIRLIWARAKANPERPKVAVIEEIGVLFQNPEAMAFVGNLYKLGRAYNLWPVGVTQEIKDFQRAEALINNTSQFIVGKVSAEEAGKVVEVLGLNSAAHQMILSLGGEEGEYKEYLAVAVKTSGTTGDVIRYYPNSIEYWLFTSKPEERARRDSAVDAFAGNVWMAVKSLAGANVKAA